MELKSKIHQGTKYTRSGCSTFFPDLPDEWFNMDEIPIPKDTARKKVNQTHRAHVPTRRAVGVPSKKVKVKASGTDSRNKVKVKVAKCAGEKLGVPKCAGEKLGVPTSTRDYTDYTVLKLSAKTGSKDKSEE